MGFLTPMPKHSKKLNQIRASGDLLEAPGGPQETPEGSRRPQETPEGNRRPPGSPGNPRRVQEAPRKPSERHRVWGLVEQSFSWGDPEKAPGRPELQNRILTQ